MEPTGKTNRMYLDIILKLMLEQWQLIVGLLQKATRGRVVITRTPSARRVLPANRQEWNSAGPHYRGNTGIQVLLRM